MSSSDLVRLGGLAALAGAVLFAIFDVLSILLFAEEEDFSVIAATGSYAFFVGLSLLALVLIQIGGGRGERAHLLSPGADQVELPHGA